MGHDGEVKVDKIWDRFEVPNMTLRELLDHFSEKGLDISMVSCGVSLLYASFYGTKSKERMPMK